MSRRSPPRSGAPEGAEGLDEVAFGGAEPTDPDHLLGPVDEFTLSVATPPAPLPPPPPITPSTPPPVPPRAASAGRWAPPRTSERSADPLTTGVVALPGGFEALPEEGLRDPSVLPPPLEVPARPGVSDATAALLLEGLDDEPPRDLAEPSVGLPEVLMPPPDTGRARPLQTEGRPPVISLEPPRDDEPRPATPRPAGPRAEVWKPTPRARPEAARGPDQPRDDTRPVQLTPSPAPPRPPEPPRPAPPKAPAAAHPDTAAVEGLDQLLTLADEPPEKEETLSSALELLSVADEPPEQEETIGGVLVPLPSSATEAAGQAPVSPWSAPPFPLHLEPPRAADAPGADPDDLELPPATRPVHLPPPEALGSLETRPIEAVFDAPSARGPAGHPSDASQPVQTSGSLVRPANVRTLNSAQLRRETWRPPNGTLPPAPGANPPPRDPPSAPPASPPPRAAAEPKKEEKSGKERSKAEEAAPAGPGLRAEPVLMWAATLIGMMLLGGFAILLLLLITYIV